MSYRSPFFFPNLHFFKLMLLNCSFQYFFFCVILTFAKMPRKRRSSNLFGGPAPLVGSQLPTFGEVGKAWIHYRMELESSNPGRKIGNREVARRVSETAYEINRFLLKILGKKKRAVKNKCFIFRYDFGSLQGVVSVRPSVPCYFRTTNMAVFEGKKLSITS